jgi:hypothetical protein
MENDPHLAALAAAAAEAADLFGVNSAEHDRAMDAYAEAEEEAQPG